MLEFIRGLPIFSLFIFDCISSTIGSRYYDKPKYYKYWKIVDSMVFAGLAIMAILDILKFLGF